MTEVDRAIQARVDALLDQMTLEEKAALTIGRDFWTTQPVERLGIPSIWLSDGPTGLRKAPNETETGIGTSIPATCFPTASAMAATWNVDLLAEVGRALGVEAQALGVQVLLGPGVNLKRSPLCGRNFEYFSEDPVLSGELAAALIAGLQSQGVGASVKHLVANEQETGRMYMDSIVDERTLRELYMRPFEIAIAKAGPWTLMAAYNKLNGTYCAEQLHVLHEIVEQEWGYQGIVISDWGAVNDRVAGIEAGLHLQMPSAPLAGSIVTAVRDGRLSPARLDTIVRALLTLILTADAARQPAASADLAAHHLLARRAAGEGLVLLKNEGSLLPLEGDARTDIALIGAFAQAPRYQGAGSSQVVPAQVENLRDQLAGLLGPDGRVRYTAGYGEGDTPDPALLQEAQDLAREACVAVVVVGLPAAYDVEGRDRTHIDLPPAHNALVDAVLAVQPATVVVLINGTAVAMPWAARVPAILEAWLGGQAGGGAIAAALLGTINPSGKLAETFPVRLEDTPAFLSFPGDGLGRVPFTEGLYTGYRWYDARRIIPLFPFGHGLSYTTFAYSDLAVDRPTLQDTETLAVSLRVRNTGTRAGGEVVQLYLHERHPRLPRPEQELKAFAKVFLTPGEATVVHFQLRERDFALYHPEAGAWIAAGGEFDLLLGASSRDIRLQGTVLFQSTHPLPAQLDRETPIRAWLDHPAGRAQVQPVVDMLRQGVFTGDSEAFLYDMPLGKLVNFGALSGDDVARMVAAARGGLEPRS